MAEKLWSLWFIHDVTRQSGKILSGVGPSLEEGRQLKTLRQLHHWNTPDWLIKLCCASWGRSISSITVVVYKFMDVQAWRLGLNAISTLNWCSKKLSSAGQISENTHLPWPSDGFSSNQHNSPWWQWYRFFAKNRGINIVKIAQTSNYYYHRISWLKTYTQHLCRRTRCRHYLLTWHLFLPSLSTYRLC